MAKPAHSSTTSEPPGRKPKPFSSADLTSQERKSWGKQMDAWQEELNDYGVDEAFIAAHEAAIQGWEYPPLKRVLQGNNH